MAEYIEYHPLKFWLDPASIAEIVAHIQTYLVNNPINSTTEIETIIHDYLIVHPELIGVVSVNGETGEVVLNADDIIASGNITIKDVLDSLQNQINDITDVTTPSFTATLDQYVNNVGNISPSANFSYSSPIPITANSFVKFTATGYLNRVAMISTCSSDGTNISPVAISNGSDEQTYSFFARDDTYIIVSYKTNATHLLSVFGASSNISLNQRVTPIETYVLDETIPSFIAILGQYINNVGNINPSTDFSYSSPIPIAAKSLVKFTATGYLDRVAMISTCASDGTNISPVVISNGSDEQTYSFFARDDTYIIVSYKTNVTHLLSVYGTSANIALVSNMADVESQMTFAGGDVLSAFVNITCVGDSLTYGAVYTSNNAYRQAYKSYPTILGINTGASVTSLATPGATASTWWASYSEQIVEKANQLTIVYLGTNGGLTDSIDTDCAGEDYTAWANTNTGCYGKIIAKSLACGSKVLLVKCYASSGDVDITNSVIDAMGEKFGVAVVNNTFLTDRKYHYWPDGSGYNRVHYNDFGYAMFTTQLIYNVSNLPTDIMKRIIPN